jgi:uncharacterized protein (TIGR03118 family)
MVGGVRVIMKMRSTRMMWLMLGTLGAGAGCSSEPPMDVVESSLTAETSHRHRHHRRNAYEVERLVSDDPMKVPATFTDPLLKNPWGLAAGPNTFWWVANNATATSTLYDGEGNKQRLEVQVPGAPTGLVFHSGGGFPVTDGTNSGPAVFIFASEDGTLSAWNPGVPPTMPSHQAFVVVESKHDAIYKGLAIADTRHGTRVYATDFHNGNVDVFDDEWKPVELPCHAFVDPRLPKRYAPFGIRYLRGKIIVTYAVQDADAEDDVAGAGLGIVDAFDTDGRFLFRVASHGHLNAPWGIALAPENFGKFGGDLLIGNFGDGHINAFDLSECHRHDNCEREGELRAEHDGPIAIEGLWALDFGKGNPMTGDTDALYFTAGPNDEADGLFGYIEVAGAD